MMDSDSGPMDDFLAFSREYAEALEALEAIERKSATIAGLGSEGDLKTFVEQFTAMAGSAQERAARAGLSEIASWFGELIERAEGVGARYR